ncbi:MAG TPA: C25 family cysteine peptidase [Pyrinomonadaceae bacterium]|nr:C25 family cysteine peptidase [Pyrinomonadaceae bacterium]
MFGKRNSQSVSLRLENCVSFTLKVVLIAVALILTISLNNLFVYGQSKIKTVQKSAKQIATDIRLSDFQAEKFADAVQIVWSTSFESKIVGFRVWREDKGVSELVNESLIPASLMKTAKGFSELGDDYRTFDREGTANSFYRLEAVKGDGTSQWFGYYNVKADSMNSFKSLNLPDLSKPENQPTGNMGQIDKVAFAPQQVGNLKAESLSNNDAGLLTNDNSAIKFEVKQTGWYKISADSLAQNGFSQQNSDQWKLYTDGIEQPMTVNADGSIEFYGTSIDTLYSGTHIYWLTAVGATGRRIAKMSENYNPSAVETWTRVVAERRDRLERAGGVLNGDRENWYSGLVYGNGFTQQINLPNIAVNSGQTATLYVDFQGIGTVIHTMKIIVNGVEVGQTTFNYTNRKEYSITLPLTNFVEGNNTVLLKGSTTSDLSFIESVRVSYPRLNIASNDQLDFSAAAGTAVKLKGFASPNVRIYDLTDTLNIKDYGAETHLETDGTYSVSVSAAGSARVMKALGTSSAMLTSGVVTKNVASDLKNTANGANFVIIVAKKYQKAFWGMKAIREQEGLSTKLVDIVDIYDEFNNGMKSAQAIKDFLQYAYQNWAVKPNFVMLVGDASVDPRNFSGLGGDNADLVPTFFTDTWDIEAVSDELFVDFNGDYVGEMVIGRLPVRNLDDIETAINKILTVQPMTLSQLNQRGFTFVADSLIGWDFAAGNRRIAAGVPAAITPYYIDKGSQATSVVRDQILAKINAGTAVLSYFGHGNVYNWTNNNVLQNADAPNMINLKRPSLFIMVACLNGAFAETSIDSLAETAMRAKFGGAYASWSASGSNTADVQEYMSKDFYQKVFTGMRVGEAARDTKLLYYVPDVRKTYIFMGDPTQRLVTP